MEIEKIITELCSMSGPSGWESEVGERVAELLRETMDTVWTDVMGNVLAVRKCGVENAPKVMLEAHMDEIGFVITGAQEGYLKFDKVGGVDARMLPACEIKVLTNPPIYGVVRTMPPHVLTSEGKIAIVRRERTRPIDERAPVSVFLESLGQLGMDQTKGLRERGRLFPPPMIDRVLVDFLCELVNIHSLHSFPWASFPNFTHLQGHKRPITQSVVFGAAHASAASTHT